MAIERSLTESKVEDLFPPKKRMDALEILSQERARAN